MWPPETAQMLVGTSRRLETLPHVAGMLEEGELTVDRAVEVTRWATTSNEFDVLHEAASCDISGIRRRAALRRRLTRSGERAVHRDRYLSLQPTLDEVTWRLYGLLPGVAGRVVEDALHQRGDMLPVLSDGERMSRGQRNADALVAIATDSLTGQQQRPDTATVIATVIVDATQGASSNGQTGAGVVAGPRVGPDTLEAILCDAVIEVTVRDRDGTLKPLGPSRRVLSPRVRRMILARDQGCVVDGCGSRYRLQPHHVIPRSQGGTHDPSNLAAVCWFHHHIVIHGSGYRLNPDSPPQRRRFLQPDSRDPPHHAAA
jgi:hypothetical protein